MIDIHERLVEDHRCDCCVTVHRHSRMHEVRDGKVVSRRDHSAPCPPLVQVEQNKRLHEANQVLCTRSVSVSVHAASDHGNVSVASSTDLTAPFSALEVISSVSPLALFHQAVEHVESSESA